MNYTKLLFLISLLILSSCNSNNKQKVLGKENKTVKTKEKPIHKNQKSSQELTKNNVAPIEEFLPNGYKIVPTDKGINIAMGNLNNDELEDAVVLIAKASNSIEKAEGVRIAVLTGADNGEYVVHSMSGNLTSAFIYNNLSKPQIKINKKVISAFHQSMRHHYELKFRYENDKGQFMLIGSEVMNYGSAALEGSGPISSNFLTQKRITNLNGEKEKTMVLETGLFPLSAINDENVYSIIW